MALHADTFIIKNLQPKEKRLQADGSIISERAPPHPDEFKLHMIAVLFRGFH